MRTRSSVLAIVAVSILFTLVYNFASYMIAPDSQKHVASVIWFGESFAQINEEGLRAREGAPFSHDNDFNTVLGLLQIESAVYDRSKDILQESSGFSRLAAR